jgi:hypothetical protein
MNIHTGTLLNKCTGTVVAIQASPGAKFINKLQNLFIKLASHNNSLWVSIHVGPTLYSRTESLGSVLCLIY